MATTVTWNGSSYPVPAVGEEDWGGSTKLDGLIIALAQHGFQKTGGLFTLSADADFGATAGLKAIYYKSRGTVADAGIIRLAKTESIAWRNNADSSNNTLATDTSDRLLYNGVVVLSSAGVVQVAAGGTGLTSYTAGDMIYATAATTLAKLAIGTANYVLTSTGSAPSWALLVNANIDAAAAIARSKVASGTADHVVINSGAGALSSEAQLAVTRGGTGAGTFTSNGVLLGNGTSAVAVTAAGTANQVLRIPGAGGAPVFGQVDISSSAAVTGALAIANGGTGQTSKTEGFDALAPTTTKGDLIVSNGSDNIRLAVGSDAQVLTADSAQASGVKWATPTSAPDQSYELSNLSLAASVAASALTIALKDKSGSDPSAGSSVKIGFRNATAGTGTYNQRTVTAALSVVVSSGSTLGHASGVAHYIYVYAIDNSGTVELAVSSTLYDNGTIVSTTAEGGAGAADSGWAIYSTTARSNVPVRLIGRITSNQATAGTWATAPSEVSLVPFHVHAPQFHYTSDNGGSIGTSYGVYTYEDKVTDTDNAYASGTYTIPRTGVWTFSAGNHMTSTSLTTSQIIGIEFYVNGATQYAENWLFGNGSAQSYGCNTSLQVRLSAGDTIAVRVISSVSTTSQASGLRNWFSGAWIGP